MERKSILITGCSSGIGQDAAYLMRRRGWQVFAACRRAEDCARMSEEGFVAPRIDYAEPDTFGPALEQVFSETGGTLDAVFHNGAYAIPGPLEDVPAEAMAAIFQANFLGWHELTRAILPVMRAQGAGRIVLNSSVLGFISTKYRGAYSATKYALEGWADALRLEMRPLGIDVVLIQPGPIRSDFRKNAIAQFERWIDWEASPNADAYRSHLLDKLYKGSEGRTQLAPAAVSEKLWQALTAPSPRARYRVTVPTHAMAVARRILPTALLDRVLDRA